jgi:hypothetical protein
VYDADGVAEEFDHEDMLQYVIDRSTGTAERERPITVPAHAEEVCRVDEGCEVDMM